MEIRKLHSGARENDTYTLTHLDPIVEKICFCSNAEQLKVGLNLNYYMSCDSDWLATQKAYVFVLLIKSEDIYETDCT